MPNRNISRNLRAKSFAPIASLAIVVGLGSSLGLARTVWGGPPAAGASDETAAEALEGQPADAGQAGADAALVDPTDEAVVPEDASATPDEAEPPLSDFRDESAASVPGASSLRARMEAGMSDIGELAVEARTDEDLVRAACVLDKQDRANDVMELGTSELLVIRDPGTSEQVRGFALEKLDAAAGRIDKLVDEAKACAGRQGPEDEVDITRNEADEPRTIPVWAPSSGLGHNPVPPPLDGGWPPAASPVE